MKSLISLIIFLFLVVTGTAKTYYIDKNLGNDKNSSITETAPWKSLEHINTFEFIPGDSILFKRGEKWIGTLKPKGSGAMKKRIVIGVYGEGAALIIRDEGEKLPIESSGSNWIRVNIPEGTYKIELLGPSNK